MVYKLAEEDKLCGVIYPTYEGFSPIPKATCDMLESKCDKTEIIVKCGESENKPNEETPQSASVSTSESTSGSTTTSTSTSEPLSESELASASLSELSSEEYIAHSNTADEIRNDLVTATEILNSAVDQTFYVVRGNPYRPSYLVETIKSMMEFTSYNQLGRYQEYTKKFTITKAYVDPRYKMDKDHEPVRVPVIVEIELPWGGKRKLAIPMSVFYVDKDIEKPIPNEDEEYTPDLPKEEFDNIIDNTLFNFGQATFDGDTLISLRNTSGGELTREDFTNFEEYVNKTLEDKLNEGRPESSRYKVKSTLKQNRKVGDYEPNNKSINMFHLSLQITYPSGYVKDVGVNVTTAIIDSL